MTIATATTTCATFTTTTTHSHALLSGTTQVSGIKSAFYLRVPTAGTTFNNRTNE